MEKNIKLLEFRVALGLAGLRLDKALSTHSDIQTRSRAAKLISEGKVTLNGKATKASQQTSSGQMFLVELPQDAVTELLPYDFPLEIIYEDDDLLVINKPAGLVVHPASGHASDTLVNALVHYGGKLSMGFGENRPGIVHRLDKVTSGLLVVAKNDFSHTHLCNQFREKTAHRIYNAIAFGPFKEDEGTYRSYLRRHPRDRKRYASTKKLEEDQGKLAITHYKKLFEHPSGLTLIQCQLETGRTHQIRVHMSEAGHPIVGDDLYGSTGRTKNLNSVSLRNNISKMNRIALHAKELGFVHPKTSANMMFTSEWPDDIRFLLEHIGLKNA